jgi:tetratricopeptide (TPR) repeat protein
MNKLDSNEENNHYTKRLTELNIELEKEPDNRQALMEKSSCLRHLKREEETLEIQEKLIILEPENIEYHFMKALILIEFSKFEEALEELNFILEKEKHHRDAMYNKGYILKKLGKKDEGKRWMQKAMRF